jgi:aminoglycoside 6'-N-acetyltransferase I
MAERIETFKAEHLDDCARLFMTAFNAEPWNDKYTFDTARKQLSWHLWVPGCVGLVTVIDEVVAFARG